MLLGVAQRLLGVLAAGDVVDHRNGVQRLARGVALQGDRERDPYDAAVLSQVALLEAHRVDLAHLELAARAIGHVAVLGMRDLLDRHADQLALGVADDFAQARVHAQEHAVEADMRQPRAGELERAPKARLAFGEGLLRGLALGDVVVDRDLVLRLALGVALHDHGEVHPDGGAVLLQIALLEAHFVDLAGVQARALLVDDVGVVGMRDVLAAQLDHLVLGIAEDLAEAPVDADEAPVHRDVREPRARELEGAAEALLALAQGLDVKDLRGRFLGFVSLSLFCLSQLGRHGGGFYPLAPAPGPAVCPLP